MDELNKKLGEIQTLLAEIAFDNKNVMNLNELALYTGLSKQTLYQNMKSIPRSKRGKQLFFDKQKIDKWLLENEEPYTQAHEPKVDDFMLKRRRAV
jgi:predicted DNA-binding transcriptional regulator AlpA